MKTSTFLVKALNKLKNGKNWLKGDLSNGRGHYCMLGSLYAVTRKDSSDKNFFTRINARTSLEKSIGNGDGCIPSFNDSERTHFSDVKRIFKAAIKRERANGN